jgi:predicted PurR-regulated permease PerM
LILRLDRHWGFWIAFIVVFFLGLWLFRTILLPFVAAMAIAYLLDPLADRLERVGTPRWLAALLVLSAFAVSAVVVLLLLWPVLQDEIANLMAALPGYIEKFRGFWGPLLRQTAKSFDLNDQQQVSQMVSEYGGRVAEWATQLIGTVLTGGFALFEIVSLLFITPVVAYYLLRDWDRLVAAIDGLLPRNGAEVIRGEARQIDRTLAGFVRGQASVCLALAVFYGVGLSLAGLSYGVVIGLLAGLISFIPYAGSLVGFIVAVGVALLQFDDWVRIAIVAGVFFVGQFLEGNFLTPKLVGDSVGLHPAWIMFALMAGASLFGFLGVLLAVPVAAVIGVITRFALGQYLRSGFYSDERVDGKDP